MSAEWLLHQGKPVADVSVFSHPEQIARLAASCPQALATARLGGDPCFDRMLAAVPYRDRFRRLLGLVPGQRLVVLSSTWSHGSLAGDRADILPWLLDRLLAELPVDEYRLAAVLHPNVWHGHGPGQVRAWLRRATAAGMLLVPPLTDWRQCLIAADCVIGDHGSVTYYGAALGRPTLLAAFADEELDPDSPVAQLGRRARRVDLRSPVLPQIERALREARPDDGAAAARWVTSDPGRSHPALRRLFYELLAIPEPGHAAAPDRLRDPAARLTPPASAMRVLVDAGAHSTVAGLSPDTPADTPVMSVRRYADLADRDDRGDERDGREGRGSGSGGGSSHIAADEDCADVRALEVADVVIGSTVAATAAGATDAQTWLREARGLYPAAAMLAVRTGPGRAIAEPQSGPVVALRCLDHDCDPAPLVSALFALHVGVAVGAALLLPRGDAGALHVVTGPITHRVAVTSVED